MTRLLTHVFVLFLLCVALEADCAGPTGPAKPGVNPATPVTPPPVKYPSFPKPVHKVLNPTTVFAMPGIATLEGGKWVGTEHIFNLPSTLGLVVELFKPNDVTLGVSEERLREKVIAILKTANLTIRSPLITEQTPLPFLNVLIMIQPIEKGFVAYVAGRLFEQVPNTRVQLKPNIVWQVITWEKQELNIFPPEQAAEQVEQAITNIFTSFVDRVKSYKLTEQK